MQLNAADLSDCTEGTFDLGQADDEINIESIEYIVEFLRKKAPGVQTIYFKDSQPDISGVDRIVLSLAMNGETYINRIFSVIPIDVGDFGAYEDICIDYISEERKMSLPWGQFLTKYGMLGEYASMCEPIYVSSRRLIDFVRSMDDMLPRDVFAEFVNAIVEKEIGPVPRVYKYNIDDELNREYLEAMNEMPHCCACEGCDEKPEGCSAGYIKWKRVGDDHESHSCSDGDSKGDESSEEPISSLTEIGVMSDIDYGEPSPNADLPIDSPV